MNIKHYRYFVADFETTVYQGQESTEVWSSASVELFSEEAPKVFHSIDEQFEYFKNLKSNLCVYYHNLKFDGNFWLYFLLNKLKFKQAYRKVKPNDTLVEWLQDEEMLNNTFKYSISDMGQWYTITIKVGGKYIEIRDSLKLLPFSVKRIGDSFKTKHKKLDMEYTGFRYAGCEITPEEIKYIQNDVYVIKEALEIMFDEGHKKLTIGSCCLAEYKKIIGKEDYDKLYPKLTEIEIDPKLYKYDNADAYIRKSYKGGWCYLAKGKENQVKYNGTTADVNSLYPSMMSSESGNRYPTGKPTFWKGDFIPEKILNKDNYYFFIRVKTRFYLKDGYLPFIQIKGNYLYDGTEALESSDVVDKKTGKRSTVYYDKFGKLQDTRVELTLTMTDYYLFIEHYEAVDFEILDGCYFFSKIGIFDEYIEKYKKIKMESKGALRELAKLFLNNLYGKMASSTDSSFKFAYMKEDNTVGFMSMQANNKQAGYIAVGSAITSYARNFTIRSAQMNYYGADKRGFIYADTDSIHCDLLPEEIKGIKVDDKAFCCWKLESCWDYGIFVRQKTYIEHVTHEDLQPIEKPYHNVKCAGMPQKCKDLFIKSMEGVTEEELAKVDEETADFLKEKRTIEDFKIGLIVPTGKLLPRRIIGGVLLVNVPYQIR